MSTRRLGLFNKPSAGGYLLDTYPAAAAYSLRKLKTGAVYACKIQRSSDSAITDIELEDSGLITLSSIVSAGGTLGTWLSTDMGYMHTWYDQSGNGYDITPPSIGSIRIATAGVLLDEVAFLGGSSGYLVSTFKLLATWSIYSVHNNPNLAITVRPVQQSLGGTGRLFCYGQRTASSAISILQIGSATAISTGTPTTADHLFVWRKVTTLSSQRIDGAAGLSKAVIAGNVDDTPISIGGEVFRDTQNVKEVIMYSSDTNADDTNIESDINSFYTIF